MGERERWSVGYYVRSFENMLFHLKFHIHVHVCMVSQCMFVPVCICEEWSLY